jgi:hypothetical protein
MCCVWLARRRTGVQAQPSGRILGRPIPSAAEPLRRSSRPPKGSGFPLTGGRHHRAEGRADGGAQNRHHGCSDLTVRRTKHATNCARQKSPHDRTHWMMNHSPHNALLLQVCAVFHHIPPSIHAKRPTGFHEPTDDSSGPPLGSTYRQKRPRATQRHPSPRGRLA